MPNNNYATSFGEQWTRFRETQIDRLNGTTLSQERFSEGTGWGATQLRGSRVLEAGCGAGRFTQVLLDFGADVCALDITSAVHPCWLNNGPHPRLNVIQADMYSTPFRLGTFDKIFCFQEDETNARLISVVHRLTREQIHARVVIKE